MQNPNAQVVIVDDDIDRLIAAKLAGLDDFAKLAKLSELIDLFSREVPAALADMRIAHLRNMVGVYTPDEVQNGTGLSANRVRKLLNR